MNRKSLAVTNGLTDDMAISADSNWIAVVEEDENFTQLQPCHFNQSGWDKEILPFTRWKVIEAVAFTPDSQQVITADAKGWLMSWDVESGEKISSLNTEGVILISPYRPMENILLQGSRKATKALFGISPPKPRSPRWNSPAVSSRSIQQGRKTACHRQFRNNCEFVECGRRLL